MYGCHVVPANDDGADLGVVFFHNAGYSTACGHGTIALVTWALDEGIVERREGENRVVVDVPSGRLETVATVVGGRVRSVTLPQRPIVRLGDRRPGRRRSRSTSPSAAPSTRRCAERVEPGELPRLIELGREIKRGLEERARDRPPARAGAARRLRRHLLAAGGWRAADPAQRDRVRRRRGRPLALRLGHLGAARAPRRGGRAAPRRRAAPPARSSARASRPASSARTSVAGRRAVVTEVTGSPIAPASRTFTLDPDDPLGEGFLLR